MSIATRAAACTSCGKRLNRKSWYYRNGKYFCKQRCWDTEAAKVAKESQEKAAKEAEAKEKDKAAKAEAAAPAPAAESTEKS
jgi:hypothetical protein